MSTVKPSATDTFYADPTPANAIRLAIADHRAYNQNQGIGEYIDALYRAIDIIDAHDPLVAALRNLLAESPNQTAAGNAARAALKGSPK